MKTSKDNTPKSAFFIYFEVLTLRASDVKADTTYGKKLMKWALFPFIVFPYNFFAISTLLLLKHCYIISIVMRYRSVWLLKQNQPPPSSKCKVGVGANIWTGSVNVNTICVFWAAFPEGNNGRKMIFALSPVRGFLQQCMAVTCSQTRMLLQCTVNTSSTVWVLSASSTVQCQLFWIVS